MLIIVILYLNGVETLGPKNLLGRYQILNLRFFFQIGSSLIIEQDKSLNCRDMSRQFEYIYTVSGKFKRFCFKRLPQFEINPIFNKILNLGCTSLDAYIAGSFSIPGIPNNCHCGKPCFTENRNSFSFAVK